MDDGGLEDAFGDDALGAFDVLGEELADSVSGASLSFREKEKVLV